MDQRTLASSAVAGLDHAAERLRVACACEALSASLSGFAPWPSSMGTEKPQQPPECRACGTAANAGAGAVASTRAGGELASAISEPPPPPLRVDATYIISYNV